jgi:hypothetical protein
MLARWDPVDALWAPGVPKMEPAVSRRPDLENARWIWNFLGKLGAAASRHDLNKIRT